MERTTNRDTATQLRGSRAIYRVLSFLGEHVLGVPGLSERRCRRDVWWEERPQQEKTALKFARTKQAEFSWEQTRSDWRPPAPAVMAAPKIQEQPAIPIVHAAPPVVEAAPNPKATTRRMNPQDLARLLRISTSLYDGRDEGRWFALPGKAGSARYRLVQSQP